MSNKLEIVQDIAIEKWLEKDKKGTVESATGTGKGFIALKAILKIPKKSNILYLFETVTRRKTILQEISKFEKQYNVKINDNYNISLMTYQAAYKKKAEYWDLIIADEIHDGLTPMYSSFFFNNEYKYILGLSATIDRSISYGDFTKGDLLDKIAPVCFQYSLAESIKKGTSRKLNIYLIQHELDDINKTIPAGNKSKPFLTTEAKNYQYWNNLFYKSIYSKNDEEDGNNQFLIDKCSRMRSSLLYNLPSKIEIIRKLLDVIDGKTLIYANSLDFLLKITNNVVSSKNDEEENNNIINAFDKNKINYIGSFKKLEQGINLSNLDNVILASYYGKEKSLLQRMGRIRNTSHKAGSVFIIVTKNTQEEKWISKALDDKHFNVINCDNINDALLKYLKNV
jgi:superfamily II DNA or RNA helicase